MSIRAKLSIIFLAIALIPLLIVSALNFKSSKASLEAAHITNLADITIFKADKIETYFAHLKASIKVAQSGYVTKRNLPIFSRLALEPNNPEFLAAKKQVDVPEQEMQKALGLEDIMHIDPDGKIVYSSNPQHYAKDFLKPVPEPGQLAFERGKREIYFSDIFLDKANDNKAAMLITAPVTDFNGVFAGVVAFEVDMAPIYKIVNDNTGLGRTGESVMGKKIGNEVLYLSPLKYDPNAALLKKRITIGAKTAIPIQNAVQGKTGAAVAVDYRGRGVIGAWTYLPRLDWGLATKIDTAEAFGDVANLQRLLVAVALLISVLACVFAVSIAKSIARPIKRLSNGAAIIGSGNLEHKVGIASKDEIGQLSRSFDKMTADLKETLASRDELNRQIAERKQVENELQIIIDSVPAMIFYKDKENHFVRVSKAFEDAMGKSKSELQGRSLFDIYPQEQAQAYWDDDKEVMANGRPKFGIVEPMQSSKGTRIVQTDKIPYFDKSGNVIGVIGFTVDITEQKRAEEEREITIEFLRLVNASTSTRDLVDKAATFFQKQSGCEAVGIRIKEGDDYPYYEVRGFPKEFVLAENSLCAKDDAGNIIRGGDGYPIQECMCGNIIEGRFDPSKPFFTKHGSFWTNCTTELLATSTEAERQSRTRNRCNGEGYESVALLPLHFGDHHLGLLQLNDKRKGQFTLDKIQLWERLANHLATAVAKFRAEDALRYAHDELEKRVEERTAELAQTVGTLQEEVIRRTQAEEGIQAERRRLNDVLETLPTYVCLLTPDYYMPFANKVFRDLFGHYPDRKCYEFLFNRTQPCENCETYKVLKTNKPQRWEWRGPNGRDYDIYDFPFKDTDGSQLILEMGIDITEQKQAQEALRSASLYARSLLEASLDPLVTISPEGKITDVNRATELATGVIREELVGTNYSDYFTEPQKANEGYRKVLAEGLVRDYPLTIRHSEGATMDVLYNATLYRNEAGQVEGIFATARDITERKAAETRQSVTNSLLEMFAKKHVRKEYLDAVVDVIHNWSECEYVGIRIKDDKGHIPYEAYVGYSQEFLSVENDLCLKDGACICSRAMLQEPQGPDQVLMTSAGSFCANDTETFLDGLSGQQRAAYRGNCMKFGFKSLAVIPIRYRDEVLGAIHIADFKKDMVSAVKIQFVESTIAPLVGEAVHRFNAEAELEKYRLHLEELVKQRTEELARSNKDLEQFAYVASHDLQEPLRAVAGFVELLRLDLKDKLNEHTREYMQFITDGASRMQDLIRGLLEYSRIGTRGKTPAPTDAKTALDRAMAHLQLSIQETGAAVTSDSLPEVCMDPVQLMQLFQNLIGNAIKFRSGEPLRIHIGASRQDNAWQFSVSDNGIGIEPQYVHRIFLIFQRLHTRQKYPGTGIGLAICKKIVERHGGRIWVESEHGRGSTFYFTVPDKGEIS
jgi:PAS domain S-box-containing protein